MPDNDASKTESGSSEPANGSSASPNTNVSGRFVFPKWANYLLPIIVLGALGGGVYVPTVVGFGFSAETIEVGYKPNQPIPYSHELHVNQLGMDCLYCHTTVEKAAFAAIPSTQVCISCHNPDEGNGVHKGSEKLQPLYDSYKSGEPIEWVKVHDLPDYSYFNHSAHINSGVSCVSCHGRVDKMGEEGVYKAEPLSMSWCLDCHREPEKHLRPLDEVTNLAWDPRDHPLAKAENITDRDQAQLVVGLHYKEVYDIHDKAYMQACSTCHR